MTGNGYEPTGSFHKEGQEISVNEEPALQAMIENGALCTSASLKETDGQFEVLGDPTDGAFVVLGKKKASIVKH